MGWIILQKPKPGLEKIFSAGATILDSPGHWRYHQSYNCYKNYLMLGYYAYASAGNIADQPSIYIRADNKSDFPANR